MKTKYIETNLIDISKITLENYLTYNEKVKVEHIRPYQKTKIQKVKRDSSKEEIEEHRKQYLKEYQHKYYLEVTKPKRKNKELLED